MAQKPKPKGWNSLSKAQQEAWKKKNFDRSTKVTEAQLNKLRKEGTPTKAIAKYKSDPSMREALNRFYGKDKVNSIAGTATANKPKGTPPRGSGPGNTRPKTRPGGPGAKTGADGRMSTRTKKSSGPSVATQVGAAAGTIAVGAAAARAITRQDKKKKPGAKHVAPKTRGGAAIGKTKGRHAAPGKTTKRPLTRTAPGKHAATAAKAASFGGKAARVAKFAVGGKVGLALMAGSAIANAASGKGGKPTAPGKKGAKSTGKQG
jgi:hypothetical protein